ncbi:beta-glucosidase [Bifidobacterium simiarum]|uniref:beta-N-acetylhexosaminidase n=2 Tax=Bifidobacterium simiarum TaxID=2045441 RepID=A0A2M9HE61_9BIFI|nr:beta-glucosidase [Bifidobacterium simiarum]
MVSAGCGEASPSARGSASPSPSPSSSAASPSRSPAVRPSASAAPTASAEAGGSSDSAERRAERTLAGMSVEEKVGQLMMVPLFSGDDPSSIRSMIADDHVGSVLLIGNWSDGVAGVSKASSALQGYSPKGRGLLICADQEGGQVQHLKGPGFSDIPSAVEQGRMTVDALRGSARTWGGQLKAAGVNVDLAPVADTVASASRKWNAPIGALDRDFGLSAVDNGRHAAAFVNGMHDAGVMAVVKHFPGLGAVSGNTDFTADGITDRTTTLDAGAGGQVEGFRQALVAGPDMVMMSLATYDAIDGTQPAAFSSRIVNGYLRSTLRYRGVVTSDSMSAEAVGSVPTDQLGVRFVSAGGDLICIGDGNDVDPILRGLLERAERDPSFARQVDQAALRVLTLKARAGLV